MNEIQVIPTVVPNSIDDIAKIAQQFAGIASAIHIDAGDGVFVQNKTWFPDVDDKLPDSDNIFYEVHLMVEEPRTEGVAFIEAGCRRVTAHVESFASQEEAHSALDAWKMRGAEVGLGILLGTPLEVLEPLIPECDVILVMSIEVLGKQGAVFDPRGVDRIKELHSKYPDLLIAVDGGVNEKNIRSLIQAGALRFSVGSAISKYPDPLEAYKKLLTLAQQ